MLGHWEDKKVWGYPKPTALTLHVQYTEMTFDSATRSPHAAKLVFPTLFAAVNHMK